MTAGRADAAYDALVVGAGFGGVYLLHRLRQEGFSVRLVEGGSAMGGVWHWNCYPGARVDSHVPNYELSIEEVWRDWTWREKFPGRDELCAYFEHADRALGLSPDVQLDTWVSGGRFDETSRTWTVTTTDGERLRCRFLLMCIGFASKPYVPHLAGLDEFSGPCHHTAQWPQEGLSMDGLRVGVIGTGASGVQVVQEAAKVAEQVTVFQRTPVTALPMRQEQLDPREVSEAKRGYPEIFRRRNSPPGTFYDLVSVQKPTSEASAAERQAVYDHAWEQGGFQFWFGLFNDVLFDETANRMAYDYWRDRTHERVDDPRVAELLAPTDPPYPFGTKRPSLEQGYYDVFNQPNVRLVDLRSTPIGRITRHGVQTSGEHHGVDLLVLATGFDANTGGLTQLDLRSTDGETFADRWSSGVQTQFGMAAAGFPNLLMVYGPQSPASFCNGPTCAELQGEWIVGFLDHLRDHGRTRVEATEAAQRAWTETVNDVASTTLFPRADSWYMGANIPGKPRQMLNFLGSDIYFERLEACATDGYPGFVSN